MDRRNPNDNERDSGRRNKDVNQDPNKPQSNDVVVNSTPLTTDSSINTQPMIEAPTQASNCRRNSINLSWDHHALTGGCQIQRSSRRGILQLSSSDVFQQQRRSQSNNGNEILASESLGMDKILDIIDEAFDIMQDDC